MPTPYYDLFSKGMYQKPYNYLTAAIYTYMMAIGMTWSAIYNFLRQFVVKFIPHCIA